MDRGERFTFIHRRLSRPGGTLTLEGYMEEFGIGRATAFRDFEYMRDRLRAPLTHDPDRGVYLYDTARQGSDRFELPGLWLTSDELYALYAMHYLLQELSSGILSAQFKALRRRIELAIGVRGHVSQLRHFEDSIVVLHAGKAQVRPEIFTAIAAAVLEKKRLKIGYRSRSSGAVSEREVSPLRLVHYRGTWYLDAYCHQREEARSFAVDAVTRALKLEVAAEDMPRMNLDHAVGARHGMVVDLDRQMAKLRFRVERAGQVRSLVWHAEQIVTEAEDGGLVVAFAYACEAEVVSQVLQYGGDVEVLEPPALREAVCAAARSVLDRYPVG